MRGRTWIVLGAILGALGVAAGAWHAHGLQDFLLGQALTAEEVAKRMGQFEVAVRYQMYHGLALVLTGILAARSRTRWLSVAGVLLLFGVLLFSGLLYALVFSGVKILGAIVPIGGLSLILAWLALAVGAWRESS